MKFIQNIKVQYFFVFIYILISFQFYNYAGFSNTLMKLPHFLSIPIMFILCRNILFIIKSPHPLFSTMRWIVFSLIISIISSWLFWNQSIILGFRCSSTMFVLLFFFYLYKIKPSVSFLENIILTLGFVYILLWTYGFIKLPTPVFGIADEDTGLMNTDDSRGMLRLNFVGRLSMILAYFLSLNKLYSTSKIKYLIFTFIFFLFIVFQLTRQLILWTFVVTIIYAYLKNPKKIICACILVLFFFTTISPNIKFSDDSIIGSMINLTEKQANDNKAGEEDVRITEYKYFLGKWSQNIVTDIIGNGMPHSDSQYGHYYSNIQTRKKLFLSDVGYAQIFVIQGIIGIFLYLYLFLKSLRYQMPIELDYARMFMLFLIPANIGASWYSSPDCQISMVICIYIIIKFGKRQRNGILANSKYVYKTNF